MKSFGYGDLIVGLGMVLVLEGLLFAALPAWMRSAMKSVLASPDNILRAVGLASAVIGLVLIWLVRH
ncbi:MAG: DUF2065 domain-containing protein [Variibacter sp.]|jgi:uncharacterized protein YjeT (DUF2065 family)|nr:DUF2065 domain-containing protein [Variibacter sp.]